MAQTQEEYLKSLRLKAIKKHLPPATIHPVRELAPNQILAAQLYAQGCYTKNEIADTCRMSLGTFAGLRKDPLFQKEVGRRVAMYDEMSKEERTRIQNDIVKPIVREIQKRIHLKNGLSNLKITTLVNMLTQINNETRLDTKDGVTSRVEHGKAGDYDAKEIQERYRKARIRENKDKKIMREAQKQTLLGIGNVNE